MSVTATCGHDVTEQFRAGDQGYCITKSQTRTCRPALSYSVQCAECRAYLDTAGVLFHSEAEAEAWLDKASQESFARRPSDEYD